VLFLSAALLLVGAMGVYAGAVPLPEQTRVTLAAVLAVAAIADAGLAAVFLKRNAS
jgi:hypothetical protein